MMFIKQNWFKIIFLIIIIYGIYLIGVYPMDTRSECYGKAVSQAFNSDVEKNYTNCIRTYGVGE